MREGRDSLARGCEKCGKVVLGLREYGFPKRWNRTTESPAARTQRAANRTRREPRVSESPGRTLGTRLQARRAARAGLRLLPRESNAVKTQVFVLAPYDVPPAEIGD